MSLLLLIIFIFGLIIGSFLTAYTYRWPRGESVYSGRSKCDKCRKLIPWYDNIPLLSYIFLEGKCRNCGKKISLRYPLVELSTGLIFVLVYYFFLNCGQGLSLSIKPLCLGTEYFGALVLPYLLFVSTILIAIFVIDLENQIIPDQLVFLLFAANFLLIILTRMETLYESLFVSFTVSLFFLMLHLVTKGRGMGLGDIKLVLALSPIISWQFVITWIFMSFISGAFIGLVLIGFKKASFGKHIPFGPFLVASYFITMFWGDVLVGLLLPWL